MTHQEIVDKIAKIEKGLSNPIIPEATKAKLKAEADKLKEEMAKAEEKVEKKEEKLEAEEKKIQSELEAKVAKLEKGLSNPNIPEATKAKFKKEIENAKAELAKQKAEIKEDVKEAEKEKKEVKAAVKKVTELAKKASKVQTKKSKPAAEAKPSRPAPKVVVKEEEREKKSEKRQSKLKGLIEELQDLIHKNKFLASKYEGKGVDLTRDAARPAKPFGYRFTGKDNYAVPTKEQIKKGLKDGSVDYEGRANRSDKAPKKEYKLAEGGTFFEPNQNAEMVLSKAKELKHHAEELENIVNVGSDVDAWEVAKMERAATDASDVTHYEDGKSSGGDKYEGYMAKGGKMVDSDEIEKRILFVNNYYEDEVDYEKKRGNYSGFTRERIIKNYQKDLKAAQKGQEFDNFLFEAGYQVKMNGKTFEDGGMMAKGGEVYGDFMIKVEKVKSPYNKDYTGIEVKVNKDGVPLKYVLQSLVDFKDREFLQKAFDSKNVQVLGKMGASPRYIPLGFVNKETYNKYVDFIGAGVSDDSGKKMMAKGGEVTFYEGQSVIYPNFIDKKMNKSVRNVHNKFANKELVIDKITIDKPYNTAKVFDRNSGEKAPFDLILNPKYVQQYADGGMMAKGGEVNKFDYMMLDRLRSDNEYYLGNGNRNPKDLWAGSVDGQIEEMKKLWNQLPKDGKPEWLSMEDIEEYEKKMKGHKMADGGMFEKPIAKYVEVQDELISKSDITDFKEYITDFYGKEGTYEEFFPPKGASAKEIALAVKMYTNWAKTKENQWGGGDSFDREITRDVMFYNRGTKKGLEYQKAVDKIVSSKMADGGEISSTDFDVPQFYKLTDMSDVDDIQYHDKEGLTQLAINLYDIGDYEGSNDNGDFKRDELRIDDVMFDFLKHYGYIVENISTDQLALAKYNTLVHPFKHMADGGMMDEVNTEVIAVKGNIMGTTTLEMKIKGMKKPQNFIVYPISADQAGKPIMIQSDTRIGFLDLSSGRGLMSQSHSNGAYGHHFTMDKKVPFKISDADVQKIKADLSSRAGSKVGNSVIFSDNSGAGMMAKGGEVADIEKAKKSLIAKAKSKGIYENFGQKERRQLEDKYGNTPAIREFDDWAMNFDLSMMAKGGSVGKVKFYDIVDSISDLQYDGDPEDLRLFSEERFNWGADNEKDYEKAQEEIENIKYKGKGWEVYATYDVSSYDYWMKQQEEQNYITIGVMFDKDTIDKSEVEKLGSALYDALNDAQEISDRYNYDPQDNSDEYAKGGRVKKYELGDMWSPDFNYNGMLKMGMNARISWGIDKLQALSDSFEDVNYHTENIKLQEAIYYLKNGDEAKARPKLGSFNLTCRSELGQQAFQDKMADGGTLDGYKDLSSVNPSKIEIVETTAYGTPDKLILKYDGKKIGQFYYNTRGFNQDFVLKNAEGKGFAFGGDKPKSTQVSNFKKALKDGFTNVKFYDEYAKGGKMAAGGMTAGRWYKDSSGQELRYVGEDSSGQQLFSDGNRTFTKSINDFDEPSEYKKFGWFGRGGELGKDGFTISQMKEFLDKEFPYSFGFEVNAIKNGTTFAPDYDVAGYGGYKDKDIKGKLFFPQYKRDHEINYEIIQGGENTYFHFLLEGENGNYYSGGFGFKDAGDVSSDYITRFLAFLQEAYGLPFQIKHEVMKKGGTLSGKATYIPKYVIEDVEINKNGKEVEIDGADLLDGIYVKKAAYKKMADGGMNADEAMREGYMQQVVEIATKAHDNGIRANDMSFDEFSDKVFEIDGTSYGTMYLMGAYAAMKKKGYAHGGMMAKGGQLEVGDMVMVDDSGYVKSFSGFDVSKPAKIISKDKKKVFGKVKYFYGLQMADGRKPFNTAQESMLTKVSKDGGMMAKGGELKSHKVALYKNDKGGVTYIPLEGEERMYNKAQVKQLIKDVYGKTIQGSVSFEDTKEWDDEMYKRLMGKKEDGGMLAKGGELKSHKVALYKNDKGGVTYIPLEGEERMYNKAQVKQLIKDVYGKTIQGSVSFEDTKEWDDEMYKRLMGKKEDGGMMAKGGLSADERTARRMEKYKTAEWNELSKGYSRTAQSKPTSNAEMKETMKMLLTGNKNSHSRAKGRIELYNDGVVTDWNSFIEEYEERFGKQDADVLKKAKANYDHAELNQMAHGGKVNDPRGKMGTFLIEIRENGILKKEQIVRAGYKNLVKEMAEEEAKRFKNPEIKIRTIMAHGGMAQGYDDREDERLAMEHGKMAKKDLNSTHARRDDARFEERGKELKNYRVSLEYEGEEPKVVNVKAHNEREAEEIAMAKYHSYRDDSDDIEIKAVEQKMAKGGKVFKTPFKEGVEVRTTVFMSSEDTGDEEVKMGTKGVVFSEPSDDEELVGVSMNGSLMYLPQNVLTTVWERVKFRKSPTKKADKPKTNRKGGKSVGEIAALAKSIRKEGEKWTDAIKRASAQLKAK